jgi:hypothetical protein
MPLLLFFVSNPARWSHGNPGGTGSPFTVGSCQRHHRRFYFPATSSRGTLTLLHPFSSCVSATHHYISCVFQHCGPAFSSFSCTSLSCNEQRGNLIISSCTHVHPVGSPFVRCIVSLESGHVTCLCPSRDKLMSNSSSWRPLAFDS